LNKNLHPSGSILIQKTLPATPAYLGKELSFFFSFSGFGRFFFSPFFVKQLV
jgi:hypothetical protein